jgi:hypothetical protein
VVLKSYAGLATTIPIFVRSPARDELVEGTGPFGLRWELTPRIRHECIDNMLQKSPGDICPVDEIEAHVRIQNLHRKGINILVYIRNLNKYFNGASIRHER